MTTGIHTGPIESTGTSVAQRVNGTVAQPTALAPDASSAQLVQIAIEKGVSVENLQVLAGLHERMAAIDARKAFFDALANFQRECPPIKKSRTAKVTSSRSATQFSYTFADLEEIVRTIRPFAEKNGLSWNWDSEVSANGQMLKVTCTLRHIAGHSEQSSMTLPVESAAAMSPQQKYGAAMTFGQRRTLSSALGLVTTDSEAETHDPEPINDDQITYLEELIVEAGADKARFLKWLNVDRVSDISIGDYDRAVESLQQKKGGKRS